MNSKPLGNPSTVIEPRQVDTGRGGSWLAEAFDLFKQEPGTWIGITVVYLLIMLASTMIPGGSILMSLAGPVFTAGMMLGCDSQSSGQGIKLVHLFEGFKGGRLGQLVVLALIYFGACLALMVVLGVFMLAVFGLSPLHLSTEVIPDQDLLPLALLALVGLALYIPIAMGMWLAPALMVLHGVAPLEAFKLSFRGCMVNFMPFLLYGVIGLLIAVAASIPLFLGWLVAAPVFFISLYTSYRDMFPRPLPPPAESVPPMHPLV